MTVRKRPEPLDRATVEAMIAEAVAAERARSEQAMAAVLLAVGTASQSLENMAGALDAIGERFAMHEGILGPLAEAFAAGMDLADASAFTPH